MATYAQLNFKITNAATRKGIAHFLQRLSDAAIEGYAGTCNVGYSPIERIARVAVPYSGIDGAVEAGGVLGYCLKVAEAANAGTFDSSWFSRHSERTHYSAI